jgi:hypothetical protein
MQVPPPCEHIDPAPMQLPLSQQEKEVPLHVSPAQQA